MAYDSLGVALRAFAALAASSLDDISSRTITTDWIKQHDNLRGDLVLVQSKLLDRNEDNPFHDRLEYLDYVERDLLAKCTSFRRGFLTLCPGVSISLQRGVFAVLSGDVSALLRLIQESILFIDFPFLRQLHVTGDVSRIPELAAHSLLSPIRSIWFPEVLFNDMAIQSFLEALSWPLLQSLDFSLRTEESDKAVIASLGGVISEEGAHALAGSAKLASLQSLNLCFHEIGQNGARFIAESPNFGMLRSLNMDWNEIGNDGVQDVISSKTLSALRALSVRRNGISDDGLKQILGMKGIERLSSFNLDDNLLGPSAGRLFDDSCHDLHIKHLSMRNCGLGAHGVATLAGCSQLLHLESLNIDHNDAATGFADIVASALCPRHLSVCSNGVTDAALIGIDKTLCPIVESLYLFDNKLTDEAISLVAKSRVCDNTQVLGLSGNAIGDEGARLLRESPQFRNLRVLLLDSRNINVAEQSQLKSRFKHGMLFT